MDKAKIDRILGQVGKPVRYMGNEYNMVVKDPSEVLINFAFAFPDVYEVGMSHLGMKILYHLINEREDTYCQRVFAPWVDMEQKMRENRIPLFALETGEPVAGFDFIGFTLQYEMSYTNVINMLDLAGIPLCGGRGAKGTLCYRRWAVPIMPSPWLTFWILWSWVRGRSY